MNAKATLSGVDLDAALAQIESDFVRSNPRSQEQSQRSRTHMPDGTTRAVLYYSPFPLTMVRGQGARLWDLDGHEYVDLVGEFTAGVFGHSPEPIVTAVKQALLAGFGLGAPTTHEAQLADLICARFPSCEQIHFCNSGNEATLFALALAQRHTGRQKILAFNGSYHGGSFNFPGGIPAGLNAPFDVVTCRYNDTRAVQRTMHEHGDTLAAVIVEPLMGSGGCIPADHTFLKTLRSETESRGTVLIFDEVMCSRLAPGGVQGEVGIRPDMTTLGKYLGGGFSFGAFGGRRELMEPLDARSPSAAAHSGTFNNNVFSMSAGLAALTKLFTPEACVDLNRRGDRLRDALTKVIQAQGVPMQITGRGSVMNIHFHDLPIRSPENVGSSNSPIRRLFHLEMLMNGFYTARRGLLALSLPLTEEDLSRFVEAFAEFVRDRAKLIESHAIAEARALAAVDHEAAHE